MKRKATAVWEGPGKNGKGALTTQSTTLNNTQYNYSSRFEQGIGTNPEELIAAAHAGCFNMKLAFSLNEGGYTADKLETSCTVSLEDGTIKTSHLVLKAKINGISKEDFEKHVEDAEKNCPISRSLTADISVDAALE